MNRIAWSAVAAVPLIITAALAQGQDKTPDRNTKVLNDRDKIQGKGFWIYNDLEGALAQAKLTGKPLLVTFRCIPCEHCAQLDESVVERDPAVQKLMDQFVGVRIVTANGMDLSLFQFDYDQSWTAFFLNADRTIYGRYGTRSHRTESADDMSLGSFSKALQGALELHRQYPKNRSVLAAKRGPASDVPVPEELPSLKGKYGSKLEYGPMVAKSCIHCHQVGEARRLQFRLANQPIPEKVLYPYPHPKILGLVPDPNERATLKTVPAGSPAAKAGFQPGDELLTIDSQPILSTADIQWVLHHAGPSDTLKVELRRGGRTQTVSLPLTSGWRQRDDISWRATSWDLRRMTTGGLSLEEAPAQVRSQAGIPESGLALVVKAVGQYGQHAAAKNAGFQKGDLLTAVDGRRDRMTESDWMAYLVNKKRPGDRVPVTVLRGTQTLELSLPMQ